MLSNRLFNVARLVMVFAMLTGCNDEVIHAQNATISRCQDQNVYAGKTLDERRSVFKRNADLKVGCSNYTATQELLYPLTFAVTGFPAGFYPQGVEVTPEDASFGTVQLNGTTYSRKQYEENFEKNYADYVATVNSNIPTSCIGGEFYGCVKRLSQNLVVSTAITGDYIYAPSKWRDIVIPTAGLNLTVQNPNSQGVQDTNAVSLRLVSKSSAKVTEKIILTFGPQQAATIERMSAIEMMNSDLYELFIGLSDKCNAISKETFYQSLEKLMAIQHTVKSDLTANGFETAVNSVSTSNQSAKLCDMKVQLKRSGGAYVNWRSAGSGSQLQLVITRW